jgi:hypothetical protein
MKGNRQTCDLHADRRILFTSTEINQMILAKSSLQFASILVLFCATTSDLRADEPKIAATPVEHVDPFISTGGNRYVCGNNPPAAMMPLGLVRLGPDTVSNDGTTAQNMSGYYYHDSQILASVIRDCAARVQLMADTFACSPIGLMCQLPNDAGTCRRDSITNTNPHRPVIIPFLCRSFRSMRK